MGKGMRSFTKILNRVLQGIKSLSPAGPNSPRKQTEQQISLLINQYPSMDAFEFYGKNFEFYPLA